MLYLVVLHAKLTTFFIINKYLLMCKTCLSLVLKDCCKFFWIYDNFIKFKLVNYIFKCNFKIRNSSQKLIQPTEIRCITNKIVHENCFNKEKQVVAEHVKKESKNRPLKCTRNNFCVGAIGIIYLYTSVSIRKIRE